MTETRGTLERAQAAREKIRFALEDREILPVQVIAELEEAQITLSTVISDLESDERAELTFPTDGQRARDLIDLLEQFRWSLTVNGQVDEDDPFFKQIDDMVTALKTW